MLFHSLDFAYAELVPKINTGVRYSFAEVHIITLCIFRYRIHH